MTDHTGILRDLVNGDWVEPHTGKQYNLGLKNIVIQESLDGAEAELVASLHKGKAITVISDPYTHGALGQSCLLYTSPSPRDATLSRMPSSA